MRTPASIGRRALPVTRRRRRLGSAVRVTGRASPAADARLGASGQPRAAVVVDSVWKRFGSTDVVAGPVVRRRARRDPGLPRSERRGQDDDDAHDPGHHPARRGHDQRLRQAAGRRAPGRASATCPRIAACIATCRSSTRWPISARCAACPTSEARERATKLLTEVGLGDSLTKKAAELSRGMHQKAQLVATIINEPDLLIVDEPFQGLDPVNAQMLKELLIEQRDRGAAVVMSTHDMGDAQRLCDRIVLIDKGTPAALRHGRRRPQRVQRRRGGGRSARTCRRTRRRCGAPATQPPTTARCVICCVTAHARRTCSASSPQTPAAGRALRGRGAQPGRDLRPRRRGRRARGGAVTVSVKPRLPSSRRRSSRGATTCAPCAGVASSPARCCCRSRWASSSRSRRSARARLARPTSGPIVVVNESAVPIAADPPADTRRDRVVDRGDGRRSARRQASSREYYVVPAAWPAEPTIARS